MSAADAEGSRQRRRDFLVICVFVTATVVAGLFAIWMADVRQSVAMLWSFASVATGSVIGFLFGIPRVLQGDDVRAAVPHPARAGEDGEGAPEHAHASAYRLQVNTNLEQISDWLTKIIVGVGLIELRNLPDFLRSNASFVAEGLRPRHVPAPPPGATDAATVLAMGILVYFAVVGFLGGYLWTRVYLTGAFSRADRGAQEGIEVGGSHLTQREAADQQMEMVGDLAQSVAALQRAVSGARPAADGAAPEAPRPKGPPVRAILWVSDTPKDNAYMVGTLAKRGIKVTQVATTAAALEELGKESYDRVITDMGRTEPGGFNSTAGIDLIYQIRKSFPDLPVLVHCSFSAGQKSGDQALAAGAKVVTPSHTELLRELELDG